MGSHRECRCSPPLEGNFPGGGEEKHDEDIMAETQRRKDVAAPGRSAMVVTLLKKKMKQGHRAPSELLLSTDDGC